MEERVRDDGYEATFVVATPRDEAWKRLEGAKPAFDTLPQPRPGQWWIPGVESPADELEVVPKERLRARKAVEPCKDTEIIITMEDADNGTRITIVQTGFGAGFSERRKWLDTGWYPILADLVLYFEQGVSIGRHASAWSSIGCDVEETPSGLVIRHVRDDGFASRAGLQQGDLILQLAKAPILTIRDLSILVRGPLHSGSETTVRYLRGGEVHRASGSI